MEAVYTNKKKVAGIRLNDPTVKGQIYNRYLQAYKKGVFNYIKEDIASNGQTSPRKYFSGGEYFGGGYTVHKDGAMTQVKSDGAMIDMTVALESDAAMKAPGLKTISVSQSGPQFLSPFMAGQRNNVGLFLPFVHMRSKEDWGIGNMGAPARKSKDFLKFDRSKYHAMVTV